MFHIAAMPKCYLEQIVSGEMPLHEWIAMSADLGLDGLEMYSRFPEFGPGRDPGPVRAQAEGLGLALPMMCHGPDFTLPDPDARAGEVAEQVRVIRLTAALGGQFCRVLSGQRRPELPPQQGVDQVVACIEECLPAAEQCGVTLVIENHYKDAFWRFPEFAQKMELFLAIVDRIDSPHFGVQYDPSNALVAGDDPIELLRRVAPRVRTMHASDRYLVEGATLADLRAADGSIGYIDRLKHGVTGQGLNDYDAIFTILRDAGFASWVSVEDGVNGMAEMQASVDFLKRMRRKYARA